MAELLHREADQQGEHQQVEGQGDQHEQAQAGTHDQLQAFAEVLRAAQGWHREWFSDGMRAETLADWRKPATEPV
ncbi:hypothetical protein V2193_21060 [Pseudomonas aeruginosa]